MTKLDLFQSRKGVHIKLDKTTHTALRTKLFLHNLTMQEFFDEFAKAYVSGDVRATKIIDTMVLRSVQFHIEGKKEVRKEKRMSELDAEKLYDLISSSGELNSGSEGKNEDVD